MARNFIKNNKVIPIVLGLGASANVLYFGANMWAAYYGKDDDPSALKNNQAILKDMKLVSVQVFFRHGARLPLKHMPGIEEVSYERDHLMAPVPHTQIPHKVINMETGGKRPFTRIDDTYITFKGGIKAGQLTSVGKEQAYELGQKLRSRYMHEQQLLQENFSHKHILPRSTNVNRCVQSLESVLAGLFTKAGINEKDPPRIHVLENSESGRWETLFPNTYRCKALRDLERDVPKTMAEDDFVASVVRRVNQIIGRHGKPVLDMTAYRDLLVFRKTHGLPVDKWLEDMEQDIEEASSQIIQVLTSGSHRTTERVLPLIVGRAFSDVCKIFNNNVQDKKDSGLRLVLYSCHDTMLVPLVIALGVWDMRWPPYCNAFMLELYRDSDDKHWVRALYSDKVVALKDCDRQVIPYEKFKEALKPYILTDAEHIKKCAEINEFSQAVQDTTSKKSPEAIRPKGV